MKEKPKDTRQYWSAKHFAHLLMHSEGMNEATARRVFALLMLAFKEVILRGDVLCLPGLGKISGEYTAPRSGFGVNDTNFLAIPSSVKIVFRPAAVLKNDLKRLSAVFEPLRNGSTKRATMDRELDKEFTDMRTRQDFSKLVNDAWRSSEGG